MSAKIIETTYSIWLKDHYNAVHIFDVNPESKSLGITFWRFYLVDDKIYQIVPKELPVVNNWWNNRDCIILVVWRDMEEVCRIIKAMEKSSVKFSIKWNESIPI